MTGEANGDPRDGKKENRLRWTLILHSIGEGQVMVMEEEDYSDT